MNARSRIVRAKLIACAFLLASAVSSGAVAGGDSYDAAETFYAAGRPVPLSAIGDDPDPILPLAIAPDDPSRAVLGVSERGTLIVRFVTALNLVSGLPGVNGTPYATAGLDAAVRALAHRRAPVGYTAGATSRRAQPTP